MADRVKYIDVVFYVQIEPDFYGSPSQPRVRGAKAVSMTQKRPNARQKAGTIMAPITMRIPEGAFLPLSPQVIVTIPEHMTTLAPIEVEAGDGSD